MSEFQLHERLRQDTLEVCRLELCRVLLMNNRRFPWLILVPQVADVRDIHDLSDARQIQLIRESSRVGRILMDMFEGDKLNVAALGNMVPQLHVHHIVRFKTDPCWPSPVWGSTFNEAYLSENAQDLVMKLRQTLGA